MYISMLILSACNDDFKILDSITFILLSSLGFEILDNLLESKLDFLLFSKTTINRN